MNRAKGAYPATPLPFKRRRRWRDILTKTALFTAGALCVSSLMLILATQVFIHEVAALPLQDKALSADGNGNPKPFPLSVDPSAKNITENSGVDTFFKEQVDNHSVARVASAGWFHRILAALALSSIYQDLASPMGRILVIESGERKEEIADHFAKILGWTDAQRGSFVASVTLNDPALSEGKYMPATYLTGKDATPEQVSRIIDNKFEKEVTSHYTKDIELKVPLAQTLTIASMLEREASDFEDMRNISGIIWNRLFKGMNLQIDATLQYAKGTANAKTWWPRVVPADKYIKSPFNTYSNGGLPPSPIANSSLDAVIAALNPRKTDCMFYFHDKKGNFHCSVTYEEHVKALKQYYGRGK